MKSRTWPVVLAAVLCAGCTYDMRTEQDKAEADKWQAERDARDTARRTAAASDDGSLRTPRNEKPVKPPRVVKPVEPKVEARTETPDETTGTAAEPETVSYRYYPSVFVYHDPARDMYFFPENKKWKTAPEIPARFKLSTRKFVTLELATDKPFTLNKEHRKAYPPPKKKAVKKPAAAPAPASSTEAGGPGPAEPAAAAPATPATPEPATQPAPAPAAPPPAAP